MSSPTGYTLTRTSFLTGNAQADSLIFGIQWFSPDFGGSDVFSTRLTYSFVTPGQSYFAKGYSPDNEFLNSFALTSAQQTAVTSALSAWSAVANVKFTLVSDDYNSAGDLRFGGYAGMDPKTAAWAYFPDQKPLAGDVWIGPVTDNPNPVRGTYDYMTFIHEIGHALGLKHPFEASPTNNTLISPLIDDSHFTLMSYNNTYSYQPTTPMVLDILVIQQLYGANMLWQTGDNVYKWAPDQSIFETIWDAGGNDTIDASNQLSAVTLNLNEGQFSEIGKTFVNTATQALVNDGLAIAFGAKIENATGSAFDDILIGNDLNNWLNGMGGADTMSGGAGNDTYVVDNVNDVIIETNASLTEYDTVISVIDYTLGANLEYLSLAGTANINATGNALGNRLTGNSGNNILDGGAGNDLLTGGLGNDTYIVDSTGDVIVETSTLSTEIDTVKASVNYTLGNNLENLTLTGTADLNGSGNGLNNVITGNIGNNLLDGGAGADTLIGGAGNDTYIIDNAGDSIVELANEGQDLVKASVSYFFTANIENGELTGTDAINMVGNDLNNVLTGNSAANVLNGMEGADTMIGGTGNDYYFVDNVGDLVVETSTLASEIDTVRSTVSYALTANVEYLVLTGNADINATGNALGNRLTGNDGNNILDGGAGNDLLTGGLGNDTYIVDSTGDVIVETSTLSTEIDTVKASVNYTLGNNLENLTLTGTADLNGSGNGLNNVITGNIGNNLLDGGAGADTLIGGAGNDIYIVDNVADTIVEQADEGYDRVNASISYTLGANIEEGLLIGSNAINLIGNSQDNRLTGNAAANNLQGGAGNDTLDGGAGADTLIGGAGNDTYIIDNAGDSIVELANEGQDLVKASVSYFFTANIENGELTGTDAINMVGNDLNNVLTGNSAANVLNGMEGADTMIGGTGNDYYFVDNVGDLVVETSTLASEIDTVRSTVSYALTANVEYLVLTGNADINATGNALGNRLTGNDGNNILDGGAGNDLLTGGLGNDTYIVDSTGDVIVETSTLSTEIDTVKASVNYTLGNNLENLTLTGTADLNGSGNGLNNVITGNIGNNLLDGGAGADTLIGGAGNDTYIIDNAGDSIVELANEGQDLVKASVSYFFTANIENGELTGTDAINMVGNDLNNVLTGNSAANVLNGMEGADTMIGGTGNDYYFVDNVGDLVVETSTLASEIDTVRSTVSYALTANVEYLVLTGNADINATGNALGNRLTGNDGNNILDGGAGNDLLTGGLGNDTYIVDSTGDVIVETSTLITEIDTVKASVNYTLGNNLENLTLTGTADLNGSGNTLDNLLIGNAGANVLNGGAGADTLIGGLGSDTLTGGSGADLFVFNAWNESATGSARDVITDFNSAQGDKINLTNFDANLLSAGFNSFTFIGASDFTGAGQVRFVDHVLSGNVSGNAGADFEIQLVGVNSFSANDLVA
ncbi:M10 family metallopeptidase C-terminal domain-containing protein [Pseudomonas sp. FP2196]|uniref:M10 family metallopeptidase C-terminal domain-containing protein n=1 Tax=Pseudomonas sp. FP2196 TaxID=2954086 RepID=UPI0027340E93|nr:M10 family metallopeptidase C-terminal domain-containing protein [Pseudomonas sp. FP2196]WLH34726.1 M10 family metallopeptidase C-terminal domain-containing protein [Pseudomonas sp. FP2196]